MKALYHKQILCLIPPFHAYKIHWKLEPHMEGHHLVAIPISKLKSYLFYSNLFEPRGCIDPKPYWHELNLGHSFALEDTKLLYLTSNNDIVRWIYSKL